MSAVLTLLGTVSRKLWAGQKFFGRWIGPAFILLALWFFIFPLGPWAGPSLLALIGGVLTGIICLFMHAPERQRRRKVLAAAAVIALGFYAYGEWEIRQGYRTETVRFDNQGVRLVGTLYLPGKPGKYPGMVILSGSAATARSLNRGNAVPFVRKGIAVLVYDRRGIGDSSGNRNAINSTAPPRDMEPGAGDAAAALEFLRSRPDMRPEAIGFIGISEGGWIAPRAAAISGHAAYLLNISASPAPFYSIVFHQGGDASLELFKRKGQKDFDPMTSLSALNIPSLWVQSGADTLVPNDAAIALLKSLQRQGKPVEYRVIPSAWHGLFVAPVKPVWEAIDPWLGRVTAEKPQPENAAVRQVSNRQR